MENFVQADRNQPYLLPPDIREWLPEDDLAHFVVAAVERVPLNQFRSERPGHGVGAVSSARDAGIAGVLLCERDIFLAPD